MYCYIHARLASQAGLPQPYPEVSTTRPTDNGERFFMEYAFLSRRSVAALMVG